MDSWLDLLPAGERQRLREKYKMSTSAYEKLREKVKGPEDLEREMLWNDVLAQLKFGLETEPMMKDALRKQIEKDLAEQGIEGILEDPEISDEIKDMLREGEFEVTVDAPSSGHDQLVLVPEGIVTDRLPVKQSLTESYVSQLLKGA